MCGCVPVYECMSECVYVHVCVCACGVCMLVCWANLYLRF